MKGFILYKTGWFHTNTKPIISMTNASSGYDQTITVRRSIAMCMMSLPTCTCISVKKNMKHFLDRDKCNCSIRIVGIAVSNIHTSCVAMRPAQISPICNLHKLHK